MLDGHNPPTKSITFLAALAFLVIFGGTKLAQAVIPTPVRGVGSGTIVIGEDSFDFTPTHCFIADEGFVMTGTGHNGTERFWVSASSAGLDYSAGPQRSTDHPTPDQEWLVSSSELDWSSDGQSIQASTVVSDKRLSGAPQYHSYLQLSCNDNQA